MGIGVFSGEQCFSRDQQVDLMGDEWGCIRYPFWGGVDSNQVKSGFSQTILVFSGWFFQFFQFILGFCFLGDLDETWNLQPLVSTSHSGLLIRMRGVLQGMSGGVLQVVR